MQDRITQHLTQQTMGKNMQACFSECQSQIINEGKSTKAYGDGNKKTILRFLRKRFAGDVIYALH